VRSLSKIIDDGVGECDVFKDQLHFHALFGAYSYKVMGSKYNEN
jgi:hypothetical protein